jgi:hypothetical protein
VIASIGHYPSVEDQIGPADCRWNPPDDGDVARAVPERRSGDSESDHYAGKTPKQAAQDILARIRGLRGLFGEKTRRIQTLFERHSNGSLPLNVTKVAKSENDQHNGDRRYNRKGASQDS